jgi:MraZ protein
MSLRGSHRAKVDEKGRLKIPAEYLDGLRQFGNQFYITSVEGNTARIYPMQVWIGIEEKLAKASSQNQAKRKFLMRTSYYGQVVEMDGQGRLLLPTVLRESAKTVGEVAVFGNLDHLEVMNVTHAADQMTKDPITAEDYKALEELGI